MNLNQPVGSTPLQCCLWGWTANRGSVDFLAAFKLLLKRQDPDKCDHHGRSALSYAAALNLEAATQELLKTEMDKSSKDTDGNSALHYAYAYGNAELGCRLEAAGVLSAVNYHVI